MPRLPRPRTGRPPITQYNRRIVELMMLGWGLDRILAQLNSEGANIKRSALHKRMKEIRDADNAGRLEEFLAEQDRASVPPPERGRGPLRLALA